MKRRHEMRFGASLQGDGSALFRLWAPAAQRVELMLGDGAPLAARRDDDGWHEVRQLGLAAGQRYRWRIDGGLLVPDPASRFNPEGPHAASELVDAEAFDWNDDTWPGRPWQDAVFYELHVGSFTPEGTYEAAAARLPGLLDLGITAVQLMPLADFPGDFGWGYDGVLPYAPYHRYGRPEDLKRFVQAAHRIGLMVFFDVVYNHFGPDGNYLHAYAPGFFTERHRTAWGAAIDFGNDTVRAFFVDNALYWLTEYHADGLRLDAVHAMQDERRPDILEELSQRVRETFAGRQVHLVLENDSNDARRLGAPATPGRYDGQWNGDVHHTLHVLLTGERDGYYAEYDRPVEQLARCLTHGFAREGGPHNAEGAPPRRAAEGRAPLAACVNFLQNHDQIGNRAFGERLAALAEPAALRLATAIVGLAPGPPLWFMGEEQGAQTPFLYFADWDGELREAVRNGRAAEFAHFPRYAEAARSGRLPDPCSRQTFERSRVPPALGEDAERWTAFFRQLLQVRAQQLRPMLKRLAQGDHAARIDGPWLQVQWLFEDEATTRRLQMNVNLSPKAHDGDPAGDGERIFSLGEVEDRRYGPWSGRWTWLR
jgi:maltooligosyltrehalose trehalohydrolase